MPQNETMVTYPTDILSTQKILAKILYKCSGINALMKKTLHSLI
jgi:hypothetical protein